LKERKQRINGIFSSRRNEERTKTRNDPQNNEEPKKRIRRIKLQQEKPKPKPEDPPPLSHPTNEPTKTLGGQNPKPNPEAKVQTQIAKPLDRDYKSPTPNRAIDRDCRRN
jgi:hypothetical protein